MQILRTNWGRAGMGLCVAVGTLGLLELVLRFAGFGPSPLYDGDPNTIWWLKPGLSETIEGPDGEFLLETNELGLRGSSPPEEGPWTLALGCSTTFGWGVEAEEAWPALLAEHIGEPVINGGQPGWSSQQAIQRVDSLLGMGPSRVIIGYIVRDAQLSGRSDADAEPVPWWSQTGLASFMRNYGEPRNVEYKVGGGASSRVPPDLYRQNLSRLIEMSGDAEVVLLSFPHQSSMEDWEHVQEELGLSWQPHLDTNAFFETDPVHLTAEGHRHLADWMASQLESVETF